MDRKSYFKFDNSYLDLPSCLYTRLKPEPVENPRLVLFNDELAHSMGLDLSRIPSQEKALLFSGGKLLDGGGYFAQAYAGHQYGHFTMLGDGRALMCGEHLTPSGERLDVQFKGSGRTPYSRGGDGRAALGPMLREYIISEAMHELGIPTTRSLAVAETGEPVYRETALPGAVLTRVASSHLRIGTFQYASMQDDKQILEALISYTVERHYPNLIEAENKALALLKAVVERQADLVVNWMRVGFIHGVMNTDNMTLSGETIDYGPCAFMDSYDPDTVFSSIDRMGRYAYQNQPNIAQWNLARLAETLLPSLDEDAGKALELAQDSIESFSNIYHEKWLEMMRGKIGLDASDKDDEKLVADLLSWMHKSHTDYTNTFRALSQEAMPEGELFETQAFTRWYERWQVRLEKNECSLSESVSLMQKLNPVVIPRNHQVERAIEAAYSQDVEPLQALLNALKQPYEETARVMSYLLPPEPSERIYQTFCGT